MLGEPTRVVKEFTEILARGEENFYSLPKRGKGPDA